MSPAPHASRDLHRALLLLAVGCSSGAAPTLVVELRDSAGVHPDAFRVVVARGEEVSGWSCPASDHSSVGRCTAIGFELFGAGPGVQLSIESRGYAFQELELTEPLPAPLLIELEPLPPFQVTDSYRTGFAEDTGEAEFASLAVPAETELGPAQLVKFYLQLGAEPRVYFQNTRRFPRHLDFARDALGVPQSSASFADATYRGADRRAFAGTLTYLPAVSFACRALGGTATAPVTLEFFPDDDLSPQQARLVYRLLAERLSWLPLGGSDRRLLYVPAGSTQEAQLMEDARAFTLREQLFGTHVELFAGLDRQFLNPGLALGTLRRFSPEQLATAIVSFRDVLLLDRLPNELPLSGGTITNELQTQLSHVSLAARARGTPNLALMGAADDPRIAALIGKLVRLEVSAGAFELRGASFEEADAFWRARAPAALLPTSDLSLQGLPAFDQLAFTDSARVGSKAANLAELHRLLGAEAPDGFAVPFSAYDAYMHANGVTPELCERARASCNAPGRAPEPCAGAQARCRASAAGAESYADLVERLLSDPELAADTPLRDASLATLSFLVRQGRIPVDFAQQLDAKVGELFGEAQVRLRSSSNVEDLPGFNGAGLYESVSARADGAEAASLRIRDVWASGWSFRAFEERSFWNVDQRRFQVGVAVNAAVDGELANGVLITQDLAHPGAAGLYVNVQRGELEVTNPERGALPEVFSIVAGPGGGREVIRQRFSSLTPEQPVLSDSEIARLAELAEQTQLRFAELYGVPANALALDLEFKLVGEERRLLIKQVRQYALAPPP
jgi:hypothetical protein